MPTIVYFKESEDDGNITVHTDKERNSEPVATIEFGAPVDGSGKRVRWGNRSMFLTVTHQRTYRFAAANALVHLSNAMSILAKHGYLVETGEVET